MTMLVFLAVALSVVGSFCLFRPWYSGLSRLRGLMAFGATWLCMGVWALWLVPTLLPHQNGFAFFARPIGRGSSTLPWEEQRMLWSVEVMAFVVVSIPLILRLYGKWIGGKSTPAELAGGAEGARAWLCPVNCVVALIVACTAWLAFDLPLILNLAVVFGLLLVGPAFRSVKPEIPVIAPVPEIGVSERDKVLAMLESGRITAEESAELFHALAASQSAPPTVHPPLSPARRWILTGACVVLAGFFFPWFNLSPGGDMARALEQLQSGFDGELPGNFSEMRLPSGAGFTVSVVGSEVKHGMGWLALVFAMVAALLPVFPRSLDGQTVRLLQKLALGVGTVILVSLVSSSPRAVGFGLVAALVGYAVAWVGLLREKTTGQVVSRESLA